MRRIISGAILMALACIQLGFGQKMTVKDSDLNVLLEVNDEGTKGSLSLSRYAEGTAPSVTTDKLYNVNGALYFSGSALGTASSAAGWTDSDGDVHLTASTDKVGIGTSDPEFKLSLADDGGVLAKGTYGSGATLSGTGLGTCLIWYPKKAAFRAGFAYSTQWDDANIGNYSTCFGHDTKATGDNSLASGFTTVASGNNSTALGAGTTASGLNSTAFGGGGTTASGAGSVAMGENTHAVGHNSTAMGAVTTATAYWSVAMGRYNVGGGDHDTWISTDPIFEIGIGDIGNNANALTVLKNGNVGILKSDPAKPLDVNGDVQVNGDIRFEHTNCVTVANPTSGDTSSGEGGFYFRNGYFVLWYNNSGTMHYLKVDVNAGESSFSTGAPD